MHGTAVERKEKKFTYFCVRILNIITYRLLCLCIHKFHHEVLARCFLYVLYTTTTCFGHMYAVGIYAVDVDQTWGCGKFHVLFGKKVRDESYENIKDMF